ncbi:hypothetical protein A2246_06855 [candidate division WOR-1 bacterium RIFOXYA2_FULL_37_7]|uniref:Outer membrane protein beta-barrel domain-containing protein n=1 Tax=candidate division WOR-1 bacterium RIFOXYB2_FULL_37_13 TaxID=1802579 RepID=A0A1F4SNJ6_UNCSA|nr:MAG: hypothetical protein A2246_06855 [candidate division WOR-1 bacterium RIFOXYA2_FULL_37_7]OGC22016.1 MAG: hypothetical protein A2310_06930 [candidate division WOR-1 bacterium RIFOXYB2_FULL_37_13]
MSKINKVCTVLILVLTFIFFTSNLTFAQSKIVKKTIKKVIQPEIAPIEPPETSSEEGILPELSAPPEPPTEEYKVKAETTKGLLGLGLNAAYGGSYLFNLKGQQGLLGALSARGDFIFADPWLIGSKIGLAEDAVEYKIGVGYLMGNGTDDQPINAIPLYADAVIYLKEGSFSGMDPFIGFGLNYNLAGRDGKSGNLGGQVYGGILADFGFGGKTELSIGYQSIRIGDGTPSANGIIFSATHPFVL